MNFQKRKNIILDLLDSQQELSVKRLAEELATSEITVRRDLVILAAEGFVFRTHGGVMKVDLVKTPFDFAHKAARNVEQKDHICRRAALEVVDGDIIFMDCGSTVFRLCQFLRNKKIRVITNSLPVVYELTGSVVQINLIGGELDKDRLAVHGTIAEEHIGRYKADKAFLGVDGISFENGLSANSENEAGVTMAMSGRSDQTFLLCDSSKIGKDSYLHFAPLNRIQTLVTEKNTAQTDLIAGTGIRVLT